MCNGRLDKIYNRDCQKKNSNNGYQDKYIKIFVIGKKNAQITVITGKKILKYRLSGENSQISLITTKYLNIGYHDTIPKYRLSRQKNTKLKR